MPLRSRGDGGVHKGGSFTNVGFTTGLVVPFLDRVFVGLHVLLRVRIKFYSCGRLITRADNSLRVRILL